MDTVRPPETEKAYPRGVTAGARSTRARIERAALDLFVARGVDAATTRDIAAAAGVSEGAIYRHFDGKDELASAIFLEIHGRLASLVREAASRKPDFAAQARAIVEAYCATADADFPLFKFHLLYAHRFMPTPEGIDNPVAAVEDIIAGAVKRREIPRWDPALAAGIALGIVLQTALQISYGRLQGPLSDYVDNMVAAALAALAVKA
ncbi:MAG: TetR/AcrR family transcriptional regulator [Parvularculaceae bacterium]|nr:TetR/AcrR family transcriptional regulator [Parvularculaceae bacterium]